MEGKPRRGAGGDEVRCLACGTIYAKPVEGPSGIGASCPRCGDIGWLAISIPLDPRPLRKEHVKRPRLH
jgi:phage FluMu protein Com